MHVRLDGHFRRVAVEAVGEVGHKLALEGETRAVVLALLIVMHHVLEASPLHERHPLCRLALVPSTRHSLVSRYLPPPASFPSKLAYPLPFAPLERPLLAMLLTILPQDLQIESLLVGVEVLVWLLCHIVFLFCGCKGTNNLGEMRIR